MADLLQHYFAVVLDPHSARELEEFVASQVPLHPCVICHHMTILYGTENTAQLQQAAPYLASRIGQSVTLQVIGIAANARVQAVSIAIRDGETCITEGISDNDYPHITVARLAEARSVESNLALAQGVTPVDRPFQITGLVTCVHEPL